jgi:hypothetical protein
VSPSSSTGCPLLGGWGVFHSGRRFQAVVQRHRLAAAPTFPRARLQAALLDRVPAETFPRHLPHGPLRGLPSHRGGGTRTVSHHLGRNPWREMGASASAEPVEFPSAGHACGLRLVLAPAERLTVGEGCPAATAVGVDVVWIQAHGPLAAPSRPTVMPAASARTGQDGALVGPRGCANRITRLPRMEKIAGRPNARPYHQDGKKRAEPRVFLCVRPNGAQTVGKEVSRCL